MAQRSLSNHLWYGAWKRLFQLLGIALFRVRSYGRRHLPAKGPVLVLSNHQSHLDPMLVGMSCPRRMNFLARQSLFNVPVVGRLIASLDAIPIDRDGSGLGGLKKTLRRLKRDEMVLIFPEGTRTRDGEVAPLKPGFCSLARRGKAPLLPVAVEGAFDAFPRTEYLPRRRPIAVVFGEPITVDQVAALDDEQLVILVEDRICRCHDLARRKLGSRTRSR
jgi:1-acyl-sn-glycerol-3-phosphate acyltransferase